MKIEEIKAKLAKSWKNGAYIEQPFFSSNERLYITKNGALFWEKHFSSGKVIVSPTELDMSEAKANNWYFRDWHQEQPSESL